MREGTEERYRRELQEFVAQATGRLVVESEVDAALVLYMNELFEKGHGANRGDVLLSALLHFLPQYGNLGSSRLPRAWRALKGWRRLCGRRSRNPVVRMIWSAVIWDLCCRGYWLMGPHAVWMIVTYRRPSEPLTIQRCDLIQPVSGGSDEWSVVLFPGSRAAARRGLRRASQYTAAALRRQLTGRCQACYKAHLHALRILITVGLSSC